MASIPLGGKYGRGKYAIVSDHQYDAVLAKGQWVGLWHHTGKVRVCLSYKGRYKASVLQLHRFCWELEYGSIPDQLQLDHIDGDPLNNDIKTNLRLATQSQNQANCGRRKDNTSGYRGVSWYPNYKKWLARAMQDNVRICLGYYSDKELAVRMVDWVMIQLHGEYYKPNKPRADYPEDT